tara:strand:+ start:32546 stop:32725 length:180 start_codon:yes stop_codon:yes gene_type:complete
MQKDLLDILVCPMCKSELQLSSEEIIDEEIISGLLSCDKCHEEYPITDGIPNLLPPELR